MAAAHDLLTSARFTLTEGDAPLYIRLQTLISDAIREGQLHPGDTVPAERDIASGLGISRVTVRKAMAILVEHGLLVQRRGSGTFVAQKLKRVEQPLSLLSSFSDDMRARGLHPSARWLTRAMSPPTPEEAIAPGHQGRRAGGTAASPAAGRRCAMALEIAVLPEWALPDPNAVEQSLYEVLEHSGLRPVRRCNVFRLPICPHAMRRISKFRLGPRRCASNAWPIWPTIA